MTWPWGKPHAPLARSCISSDVLSFAGKQMPVIFLLKTFSNLTAEMILRVFGGSSLLVVLAESGVWKEKGGWREKIVAAGGIIPI